MFVVVVVLVVAGDWVGPSTNLWANSARPSLLVFCLMVWTKGRYILLPVFRPRKSTQQPFPNYFYITMSTSQTRKSLEWNPSSQISASETN